VNFAPFAEENGYEHLSPIAIPEGKKNKEHLIQISKNGSIFDSEGMSLLLSFHQNISVYHINDLLNGMR
jgi:hypothetical protein